MQPLHLLSLFFLSLTLASPSDVLYIKKLLADEGQLHDTKGFDGLVNIYTKNATYNDGVPGAPNIHGIDAIKATLARILPPEVITHDSINTESITLLPPFDEQGAAGTATGIVYTTATYIGQGNLTGHALTFCGKLEDRYVKTADFARYGGWRISERFFIVIVSFPRSEWTRPPRDGGEWLIWAIFVYLDDD